jgi:hypothetical protein
LRSGKRWRFSSGGPSRAKVSVFEQRSEDVAEVVVDLGDGGAEGGQARLLLERRAQLGLHVRQLVLGDAQLVGAGRGRQRARQVLRVLSEGHHALGHAPHGAHQQPLQAQIDEGGGDQRDDDREREDAVGIVDESHAHGRLVDDDLDDRLRMARRWRDDAQHPVAALEQSVEGIPNQHEEVAFAQVEAGVDGRRHVTAEHELHTVGPPHGDDVGAGLVEQFALELVAHHVVGRGHEREDGGVAGVAALLEKAQAESAGRGRKDQHFAQHHEHHGERQQPRGEATEEGRHARAGSHGRCAAVARSRRCSPAWPPPASVCVFMPRIIRTSAGSAPGAGFAC